MEFIPVIVSSTKEKACLSFAQKTFNRLSKKIKTLHDEQKTIVESLDVLLNLYYEKIKPVEQELHALGIERIKIAYQYYKDSKKISKKERAFLKEWVLKEIDQALSVGDFSSSDGEVKDIFKELSGIDYDEQMAADFESVKDDWENQCKEMGIDVDFSSIDHRKSREEIMQEFFKSIGKAVEFKKEAAKEEQQEKKKTKKQLEKEEKVRACEKMQAESVSTIYKRLAKILHPDLEQDSNERSKKEEFMKRLTGAYANKDLFGLLTIELEWIQCSTQFSSRKQFQNDEQIKIYNGILKEQIKELEAANQMLPLHPRYSVLHSFYGQDAYHPFMVRCNFDRLCHQVTEMRLHIEELQTDKAIHFFKKIIACVKNKCCR